MGDGQGTSEAGESRRVLGALLTWMAERKSRVFILAELARTRPLSVVMGERIAYLRAWAQDRTVKAD